MNVSDKKVWRCRVCRMETTPRCPSCRTVIGLREAETATCDTCRSHLPDTMADCPQCSAKRSLYYSPSISFPVGMRGLGYSLSRGLMGLLGLVQFIGLMGLIVSFAGLTSASDSSVSPDSGMFRLVALAMMLVPVPIQLLLAYMGFRLRRIPVIIGQGKHWEDHP